MHNRVNFVSAIKILASTRINFHKMQSNAKNDKFNKMNNNNFSK